MKRAPRLGLSPYWLGPELVLLLTRVLVPGCCGVYDLVTTDLDPPAISRVPHDDPSLSRHDWSSIDLTLEGPVALVDVTAGSYRYSELRAPEPGQTLASGAEVVAVGAQSITIARRDTPSYHLLRYDAGPASVSINWGEEAFCSTTYPGPGLVPIDPRCGDGFVTGGEECDDENDITGDGCDDCLVEPAL